MSDFVVEKNVPMPSRKWGEKNRKYPFEEMQVGESFFVEGATTKSFSGRINYWKKKGVRYSARTVTENGVSGVRVWRIE